MPFFSYLFGMISLQRRVSAMVTPYMWLDVPGLR
jgi:hypothetical protein